MPAEFKDSARKSDGLPWRDLSTILRFPLVAAVIARMSCPKRLYQPTVLSCSFFQLFEFEFLFILSYFLLDIFLGSIFFLTFSISATSSHLMFSLSYPLYMSCSLSLSPSLSLSISLSVSLAPSLSFSVSLSFPRSLARSLFFDACSRSLSLSLFFSRSLHSVI